MRVVEKSAINDLILEGEEKLKALKPDYFGKDMYVPSAIDWMISELETLRKEVETRVIEVQG